MVHPGRFVLPGLSAPVVPNSKPPLLRTFCAWQANEAITSNALTNDGIVPFIFDVLEVFGIIEPCVDRQRASAERAQPRRTGDVNRESGTASATRRWLQRFCRRLVFHAQCRNKPRITKNKAILKTMMDGVTSNQKITREALERGLEI